MFKSMTIASLAACMSLAACGPADEKKTNGGNGNGNGESATGDVPTPAALVTELKSAIRMELADDDAPFGTNAWRDLDQLIDDGVARLEKDGMTTEKVTEARDAVRKLAERARKLAADSPNRNITRVELMAALSELSPLYPFVTEPIPVAVAPEPGTSIDPPRE